MLRELCRTFDIAHHIQYQDGLHSQFIPQAYIMMLQCVYSRKSDENERFLHFTRHFTLKLLVWWLCMLRELCRTLDMAHHIQYQDGLHSQFILQAYIMMLQCVYSRKRGENERFLHFTRHFTLKLLVRWLCMLRELCRTFDMAHHIQYQDGLHSQFIPQAYIMMLQCVYSRKSDENERFLHFT